MSATCFQEQRQVSFVAGNKYYNNLNGHFYENVPGTINWVNALAGASTQSYFGRQGYLATMTSLAETNFIWKIIPSDSWMGASDNNVYINAATGTTTYATNTGPGSSDGRWYWVSGPEKGTLFSVGHSSPTTQSGQFAYWNPGEPNGNNGGEDCGQFYAGNGGHWNDLNFSRTLASYIVEYGGMSTDNVGANVVFTRDLLLLGAPSGTITGGNTTVCSTVNSTTLTLTGLISGGTVVKWQYSYDDFLTAGIDIVNTSTTHTVTNINQNTYYRAVVNTPGCTGLTTSSTRINVDSAVAGNIVADNNTICVNANVNFTLNGNSGNVTKWQVSTSSTFASGITDIANTTSAMSYQLIGAGTYYFRAVIESCSNTVYTAGYTISCIAGTAPAGGTISNASYCNGSNSGTLTLSGHTGTITKWQYSIDGGIVWSDIVNTTNTYNFSGITTTRKYRALLTSGTCGTAWSSIGLVSVSNLTPSLSYSVSGIQNYVLNSVISSLGITNSGGSILDGNYSVVPALPTGLILETDGAISGTPTVTSAATTYTITGANACSSDTATVEIATGTTPTLSNFSNINKTYYDGSYTIVAPTSNSTGAFNYTSSNTLVATISGTTVTILSAGTTTITANQATDASYTNGSITAILTVSSIAVITKNGQSTSTNTNYVNLNGKIGGGSGVTKNGDSKYTQNLLSIGDNYNGGIIGYILQGGDPGYDSDVQHGLIVAPVDQSSNSNNGTYGAGIQYVTPVDIGSGQNNTALVALNVTFGGLFICDNLNLNGYSDWFMPSRDELLKIYDNRVIIGGFNTSGNELYWTSSFHPTNANYAYHVNFTDGIANINIRTNNTNLSVRAIRYF